MKSPCVSIEYCRPGSTSFEAGEEACIFLCLKLCKRRVGRGCHFKVDFPIASLVRDFPCWSTHCFLVLWNLCRCQCNPRSTGYSSNCTWFYVSIFQWITLVATFSQTVDPPIVDGHAYFTKVPVGLTNTPGSLICLGAEAAGDPSITSKWYKNDFEINLLINPDPRISITEGLNALGVFETTLCISNADRLDSGSYRVTVRNAAPPSWSEAINVLVGVAPALSCNPLSRTNLPGTTVIFHATPTGTDPLTCQWYFGSIPLRDDDRISGSNLRSLVISNIGPADVGRYSMRCSNPIGSAVSTSASLSLKRARTQTYSSSTPIAIPLFGSANPYSTPIIVSGVNDIVTGVTLKLHNVSHTSMADMDVLLTGPSGQSSLVLSDVGQKSAIGSATLSFSGSASSPLPAVGSVQSGDYLPTDYDQGQPDTFRRPAPQGPYTANFAEILRENPNGRWTLFVVDDSPENSGLIAGGWSLEFEIEPISRGCIAPPDGLVGWWKGDGDLLDSVGNLHALPGSCEPKYSSAKVGNGFQIQNGDFLQLPYHGPKAIPTMAMWIKTAQGDQSIASGLYNWHLPTWRLGVDPKGAARYWHFENGTGRYVELTSLKRIDDGKFHHLVTQADTDFRTIRLFVDGMLESSYTVSDANFSSWATVPGAPLNIGYSDTQGLPVSQYAGAVDEVQLYDRILRPAEIASLYASDNAGTCAVMCPIQGTTITLHENSAGELEIIGNTCPGAVYVLETVQELNEHSDWKIYASGVAANDGSFHINDTRRLPQGFYRAQ